MKRSTSEPKGKAVNKWTHASGLIVAGALVVSGLAVARQEPYPDLEGTR